MIGGEYFLQPGEPSSSSLKIELSKLFAERSYFATGRDALFALVGELKGGQIWLPNFLCHSVWSSVAQAGKSVKLYEVNNELVGTHDWLTKIQTGDAVLVIHFFGIPDIELLEKLREKNVTVVSDVTHLLFNADGLFRVAKASDFSIASLRKSGPFPDGAICGSNMHAVPGAEAQTRQQFWSLRAAAMLSRGYSARKNFQDDENFLMFRQAEALVDSSLAGRYAMSFASGEIMSCMDIASQRAAVADNTVVLASRLARHCDLPANGRGMSQYFICAFDSKLVRDEVRNSLREKRIFCPVHWETAFLPQPHQLSERLLSIPCDARYNARDMSKIADGLIGAL